MRWFENHQHQRHRSSKIDKREARVIQVGGGTLRVLSEHSSSPSPKKRPSKTQRGAVSRVYLAVATKPWPVCAHNHGVAGTRKVRGRGGH